MNWGNMSTPLAGIRLSLLKELRSDVWSQLPQGENSVSPLTLMSAFDGIQYEVKVQCKEWICGVFPVRGSSSRVLYPLCDQR